jgi:hypothetical protein
MEGVEEGLRETPRSEVDASLRGLTSGSNRLPWTEVILIATSTSGQGAVLIGRGFVCSRAASSRSGRGIRAVIIAVKHVAKRPGAGGVGGRASVIARPRTASNSDANSRSGIVSGCASGPRRQLTRPRRARASARRWSSKIFRNVPVIGRVATSCSRCLRNIRASAFVVWRADRLCVACWTAKRATRHGVGAVAVNV